MKSNVVRRNIKAEPPSEQEMAELRLQINARFPEGGEQVPWILPAQQRFNVSHVRDLYSIVSNFVATCRQGAIDLPTNGLIFTTPRPFGFAVFLFTSELNSTLEADDGDFTGRELLRNEFGVLWDFQHKTIRPKFKGSVTVRHLKSQAFCTVAAAWDVNWFIEDSTSTHVRGWIVDLVNPPLPIDLTVFSGSKKITDGIRNINREDVSSAHNLNFSMLGFEIRFQTPVESLYNIRIRPQGVSFDLVSGGAHYLANGYSERFARSLRLTMAQVTCQNALEERFVRLLKKQLNAQAFSGYIKASAKLFPLLLPRPTKTSDLSVIIPVYSGFEETRRCIESVLSSRTNLNLEVLIGYDAGPDDRLKTYLEGLTDKRLRIDYRAENLGFVQNVNQLVAKKSYHDFLLLNADAVISHNVLDRMVAALDEDRSYASLSPLSNNATIFSIYHGRDAGFEHLDEINDMLYTHSSTAIVSTPVSHGYCMLINGDAHSICGMFDAETWGKGYGEETDWCQRVFARTGMRHGAVLGSYVYHEGSVSFGVSVMNARVNVANKIINERYPDYHESVEFYQISGILNKRKIYADMALMAGRLNGPLIISHYFGGGIDTYVLGRLEVLESNNTPYLIAQYYHGGGSPYWKVAGSSVTERFFVADDVALMVLWLRTLGITSVEYEHNGDASIREIVDLVGALKVPLKTSVHDFGLFCPRINLINHANRYCAVQDELTCELCVTQGGVGESAATSFAKTGSVKMLRKWSGKLISISSEVVAPSDNTKELFLKAFPDANVIARPHHAHFDFVQRLPRMVSSRTIGVIGAISMSKGLAKYKELADYLQQKDPTVRLVFVGYTQNDGLFANNLNVRITGKYKVEDLDDLIDQYDITACLHLNCWPETFSYTLSESLRLGLYPFFTEIGAVGERLTRQSIGHGYELEASLSKVAADVIKFFDGSTQ